MRERVLVRKRESGAVIGCCRDIAEEYVRCGMVDITPVSPLQNGLLDDNGRFPLFDSIQIQPAYIICNTMNRG